MRGKKDVCPVLGSNELGVVESMATSSASDSKDYVGILFQPPPGTLLGVDESPMEALKRPAVILSP